MQRIYDLSIALCRNVFTKLIELLKNANKGEILRRIKTILTNRHAKHVQKQQFNINTVEEVSTHEI